MAKVEVGRFSERLRRALGMKGQELVAAELSPEISPVIVLEDNAADQQFLQGVRLCGSDMLQAGLAANNTIFRLRNPVESGVLASFSRVSFSSNTDSISFNLGYSTVQADLATVGVTTLRDHRWSVAGNATAVIASRTNGVGLSFSDGIWIVSVLASSEAIYDQPFILLPGETLEFGTASNDIAVRFNASWSERRLPVLEGELA